MKTQWELREKEYREQAVTQEKILSEIRKESNQLRERAAVSEAKLSVLEKMTLSHEQATKA